LTKSAFIVLFTRHNGFRLKIGCKMPMYVQPLHSAKSRSKLNSLWNELFISQDH